MIQPVSALSPKVFRGSISNPKNVFDKDVEKRVAMINSAGMSFAMGVLMMLATKSYTSSWKKAGIFGIGATLFTSMLVMPRFFYKTGHNLAKDKTIKILGKTVKK